ncbi:MAG: hypothetical protein FD129_1090 [bacterium]|nr:MAG: hypothetical protein FD129_1090 [bacterium]
MQHANLTTERWSRFTLGQQLLMIANEMNRAARQYDPSARSSLRLSLERVLNLVDATVSATIRPGLRRELLRWRDLVAREYIAAEPAPGQFSRAPDAPSGHLSADSGRTPGLVRESDDLEPHGPGAERQLSVVRGQADRFASSVPPLERRGQVQCVQRPK